MEQKILVIIPLSPVAGNRSNLQTVHEIVSKNIHQINSRKLYRQIWEPYIYHKVIDKFLNKSNKTAAGLLYIEIYEDFQRPYFHRRNWTQLLNIQDLDTFKSLSTVLICEFHTPDGDHDEKKKNISQDQSGRNTDEPQDINDKIQPAPEAKVGAHAKFKPDNDNQKYPYDIRHYNKYRHKINKYWHLIGNTG